MGEQSLGVARPGHAGVLPIPASGALVSLLPQRHFTPLPATAVSPRRDGEPAKSRLGREALKLYFQKLSGRVVA